MKLSLASGASKMSLGTWDSRSSKYQRFLNISNVMLLITSAMLIITSSTLITRHHMLKLYFWDDYFYWCPILMFSLGVYTFVVSGFGFLICEKESRWLIISLAVLLSIAFVGQLASVFTAWRLRDILETEYPTGVQENMNQYGSAPHVKANWDSMQTNLRCCGGKGHETAYMDWGNIKVNGENYTDVPDSCCHEYSKGCGSKKLILPLRKQDKLGIWTNACIDILKEIIFQDFIESSWGWAYIGFGVFIALVELFTVVLACAYVAQINRRQLPSEQVGMLGALGMPLFAAKNSNETEQRNASPAVQRLTSNSPQLS